jgi:hypothetical protein
MQSAATGAGPPLHATLSAETIGVQIASVTSRRPVAFTVG